MWSIILIVVAAVASSLAMLGAGVTLAVTIERHKHRKILKAHGIDITSSNTRRGSAVITDSPLAKRLSVRESLGLTTSESAGWNVPGSGQNTQSKRAEALKEVAHSNAVDDKVANDTTRQTSSKNAHKQRKLRKCMPLHPSMHSPLSAITEYTGSPKSCSSPVELPTELSSDQMNEGEAWPLPVSRPSAVAKGGDNCSPLTVKPNYDALQPVDRTRAVATRPKLTIRSVSTASNMSNPPDDPLPPLPKIEISTCDRTKIDRFSISSIDTTDSSVLEHMSNFSVKPPSQALREFNFDLDSTTLKLGSPARQTRQGFHDQRTAITSHRASMDAGEEAGTSSSRSASRALHQPFEASSDRQNSIASDLTTRHSMFANCTNIRISSSLISDSFKDLPDRFKSGIPVRSASVSVAREGGWTSRPYSIARCDKIGRTTSQIKGHKRQNCVRITIPSIEIKNRGQFEMPQVMEEPESDPINPPGFAVSSASVNSLLWPQPLMLPQLKVNSMGPAADCDVFCCNGPSTPRRHGFLQDFVEIPASSASSPSRGHLTPTLPSPAYSSARLFSRVTKVQGPRNIPHRNQNFKRKSGTPDLRRSVMMLRNIDVDEKILEKSQDNNGYTLGSNHNTINSSGHWSSSMRTWSPLSSRSSTPQKNIAYSQSTMSIWEDISIRDDSPEPELPVLTHSNILFNNRESQSPKNLKQDDEARENEGINALKAVGLGLQLGNIPETPKSLYDHEGFLKE